MSIRIMSQVWDSKKIKATEKLALLCLADHANDDGWAYPSYGKLALRTGVTKRQAMNIIDSLVNIGAVWVVPNPGHRNGYIITLEQKREEIIRRLSECEKIEKGEIEKIANLIEERQRGEASFTGEVDFTSGGEASFTTGVKPVSPKPSKNRQVESSVSIEPKKPKAPRPRDLLFDAIVTVFGLPETSWVGALKGMMLGTGKDKKVVEYNFDIPATAEEVLAFGDWYRKKYPNMDFPQLPQKIQMHFYNFRKTQNAIATPTTRVIQIGGRNIPQIKKAGQWVDAKQTALEMNYGG